MLRGRESLLGQILPVRAFLRDSVPLKTLQNGTLCVLSELRIDKLGVVLVEEHEEKQAAGVGKWANENAE